MSFSKEEPVIPNQHLSFDQIRGVASAGPSSLPPAASGHLGDCRQCTELVKFVNGLGEMKPDPPTDLGDCPSQAVLLEITEGLTVPDTSLYRHITRCHRCVTTLREFAEDLKDDNLPETKNLRTASPAWQHALAGKIASSAETTFREPRRLKLPWIQPARRARWVYAGALAMVVCLGVVSWFVWRSRPSYADRLLAEAYTSQRTMEMRISGARYAPLRVRRGAEASRLDRPPELLQAEAVIARSLAAHPNDPAWLSSRGRAELLDWQYEAAIKSFNHALGAFPKSPALLTDLASAYFQRAEALDRAIDYATCVDLLGQALASNPNDPVALFNRALAEGRLFLYGQAIKDWEHYLQVDPRGEWAQEAKRRLADLQQKIREHDRNNAERLLDPPTLVLQADLNHDSTVADVDRRIEDYLRVATRDWLPVAFPLEKDGVSASQTHAARGALQIVATTARVTRGDDWLSDLLDKTSSPSFPGAVTGLSNAISAADSGGYVLALRQAREAAKLFHTAGNNAGALRAQAEEVYALHFSDKSQPCLSAAASLIPNLRNHRYAWLTIQMQLEYAICSDMLGYVGMGQTFGMKAVRAANRIGYTTILLRGLGLVASQDGTSGNFEAAWNEDRVGLARYWDGNYPPMRAYSFYAGMDTLAEDNRQWFLDMAVLQEGLAVLGADENRVLRAVVHDRLGQAALMAGLPRLAEAEFKQSALLYASLPQDEITKARQADAQIWLARVDITRGELDRAQKRLLAARDQIAGTSHRYSGFDFYQTLGELQAGRGNIDGAEESLRSAVAMAETGLQSLRSEHDRLTWDRETSTAYRALVELKLRRQDSLGALETWEWYRGAALRQGPDGQLGPSLPELTMVSKLLPILTDITVVSYGLLPKGLAIWAYDSRGITAKLVLDKPKEIERLARRFRELCSDPSSDPANLQKDGKKLYDFLITPIADRLPEGRPLMIEADGVLADVPLEVLQDAHDRYLIDMHEIVWSPGLYYIARLRPSVAFNPRLRALVVGVSSVAGDSAANTPPVQDAIREAEIVANRLSGARLLVGSSASLDNVESDLPHAVIFHFAGHAVSGVEGAGLPLGKNASGVPAILTASTLNALRLRTTGLTVLAGCSTENGINGGLFDSDSMARAFLRAGTPHVVASRWSVDSNLTATFTDAFYDRLLAGNRVSDALRVAAAKVRANPATAHPFYWAAFKAFGRR